MSTCDICGERMFPYERDQHWIRWHQGVTSWLDIVLTYIIQEEP